MNNITIKIELECWQSGIQFLKDGFPQNWENLSNEEQMHVVMALKDHYELFLKHLKLK